MRPQSASLHSDPGMTEVAITVPHRPAPTPHEAMVTCRSGRPRLDHDDHRPRCCRSHCYRAEQSAASTDRRRGPPGMRSPRRRTRTIRLGAAPMGGDEHVAVLTPLAPSVPATATTGPRTLPVASDAQARTPRPDAITFEVSGEAELERLAELAWKGPGAPRTALVARGADMAVLTRALRHAEGAYLRLDTLIYGVSH